MKADAYHERWVARFWARVDTSGGPLACWPWKGATNSDGYGVVWHRDRDNYEGAHRKAYELEHGPIPPGVLVLHTCDNPPCCNQVHLFTGTTLDNVQDKMQKGRWRGNPLKRRVKVLCSCGKLFELAMSHYKRGIKHCSLECRWKVDKS